MSDGIQGWKEAGKPVDYPKLDAVEQQLSSALARQRRPLMTYSVGVQRDDFYSINCPRTRSRFAN